ncbi:MAG: 50S ribosomal protein L22 [Patescibacteria group bacterium]
MEVVAKLNSLRMAPRKVRLVADLIRRLPAIEAERQLVFLNKASAKPLLKLLRSAIANAEHNFKLSKENLWIKFLTVDGGATIKRFRPRAHGSAAPIRKRTSHITLKLSDEVRPTKVKRTYKPRVRVTRKAQPVTAKVEAAPITNE